MNRISAWVTAHKPQAAAGALVGVVGVVAYVKKRNAGSGATPATSTDYATTAGTAGGTAFDSSGNDEYNSLEAQFEQLQNTVNGLSTTPPVAGQVPVTTPGTLSPPMTVTAGVPGAAGGVLDVPPSDYLGLGTMPATTTPTATAPTTTKATPTAAPSPTAGYTQVANPTALKALPAGTNQYTVVNGVITYLTPTAAKSLKPGTPIYTKN